MPFYRPLLKEAWEITWRHKSWWWLGIFASFLGNGGIVFLILDTIQKLTERTGHVALWSQFLTAEGVGNFFFGFVNAAITKPGPFLSLLIFWLLVLVVFFLLVWIVTTSISSIIDFAGTALRGETVRWARQFLDVKKTFWNVLGVLIVFRGALFLITLLVGAIILMIAHPFTQMVVGWLGVMTIIILSLLTYFLIPYSIAGILFHRLPLWKSIQHSFLLLIHSWLLNVEMAVILLVINLLVKFAWGIVVFLLLVPFVLLGLIFFFLALPGGISGTIVLTVIIFTALFLLLLSILTTFQYTTWTLLYLRLIDTKGGTPKALRVAAWIRERFNRAS